MFKCCTEIMLRCKYTVKLCISACPELPKGHPAYGFMTMNFAANFLGLDNTAKKNKNRKASMDIYPLFLSCGFSSSITCSSTFINKCCLLKVCKCILSFIIIMADKTRN